MTTTTRDDAPLDTFELALLRELRGLIEAPDVVTGDRPVTASAPPPRRPVWRHPATRIAAAAAAVAAIAGGFVLSPLGSTPAFAVTTAPDGEVTVTVNRLEGAAALEKALRAAGITADVTFPGQGKQCATGRYAEAPRPSGPPSGRVLMSASTSSTGGQSISVPKDAVGPGQTLVLESMWPADGTWAMRVGIASGPVSDCVHVPYVAPPGQVDLSKPPAGHTSGATSVPGAPRSTG
ncbi:MAG: hypothetical protein U0Q10_12745 [Dermatophilaceae bacterium]